MGSLDLTQDRQGAITASINTLVDQGCRGAEAREYVYTQQHAQQRCRPTPAPLYAVTDRLPAECGSWGLGVFNTSSTQAIYQISLQSGCDELLSERATGVSQPNSAHRPCRHL
ncbi:hypothetical protein WJX77_000563 [Trebouxia sp. C0004]